MSLRGFGYGRRLPSEPRAWVHPQMDLVGRYDDADFTYDDPRLTYDGTVL